MESIPSTMKRYSWTCRKSSLIWRIRGWRFYTSRPSPSVSWNFYKHSGSIVDLDLSDLMALPDRRDLGGGGGADVAPCRRHHLDAHLRRHRIFYWSLRIQLVSPFDSSLTQCLLIVLLEYGWCHSILWYASCEILFDSFCVWLFCWCTVGTALCCLGHFVFGYFVGVQLVPLCGVWTFLCLVILLGY